MDKRYTVISEELATGEMTERGDFDNPTLAEVMRERWDFGRFIGWVRDNVTGRIGIMGDIEKGEVH